MYVESGIMWKKYNVQKNELKRALNE